jgi:hypothetical protein
MGWNCVINIEVKNFQLDYQRRGVIDSGGLATLITFHC